MSLHQTLKLGRELRAEALASTQSSQVEVAFVDPHQNFPRFLTDMASEKLAAWVKKGKDFDYLEERLSLLRAFGETARTCSADEYIAANQDIALGLDRGSTQDCRYGDLDMTSRKEIVIDTVARWLWLQKRSNSQLTRLTPQDAREAAIAAVEAQASKSRRKRSLE